MLPADASYRLVNGRVVPDWIGPSDHPWLRDVVDRLIASAGRPRRELDEALDRPLSRHAPPRRLRMVREVARRLVANDDPPEDPTPAKVREVVFGASSELRQGTAWTRDRAVARAAEVLGVSAGHVEATLLLDLPSERTVVLPVVPDESALAARTNLALATCLCARANTLTVRAWGNARDLVRHVRLQRLLFVARRVDGVTELQISGPTTLFRRTTLYGRAYASILPRLPWCERFALSARCALPDGEGTLELGPQDPIWPSTPPRRFDSKLEERFVRDLHRAHPEWTVIREPEPVEVDGACWFPDFALERGDRRAMVEIVGFWTPEYLAAKVARLRSSAGTGWIVCVDERLDCGVGDLPPSVHVVPFRNRVPVDEVVARAVGTSVTAPPGTLDTLHPR